MADLARVREAIVLGGLDAIVASSYGNVYYTCGAIVRTVRSMPGRPALVMVPARGEPVAIVCSVEERLVRSQTDLRDVRVYQEFRESPIDMLAEVLRERSLSDSRIGIEKLHLAAHWYERLRIAAPALAVESCDAMFESLRAVKSSSEIGLLKQAADVVAAAIVEAGALAPGRSEREIAGHIQQAARERGATEIKFCYVGAGTNSGLIHPLPSEKTWGAGEVLRVDVAVCVGMYGGDLAYTWLPQRPTERQRRYRDAVWNVKEELIRRIRPGVRAADLFEFCHQRLSTFGIDLWMPHVGHGIGIEGSHEFPALQPVSQAEIAEGMVLCIEPLCTSPEGEAYHFEDMVVVGGTGASRLSVWKGQ